MEPNYHRLWPLIVIVIVNVIVPCMCGLGFTCLCLSFCPGVFTCLIGGQVVSKQDTANKGSKESKPPSPNLFSNCEELFIHDKALYSFFLCIVHYFVLRSSLPHKTLRGIKCRRKVCPQATRNKISGQANKMKPTKQMGREFGECPSSPTQAKMRSLKRGERLFA